MVTVPCHESEARARVPAMDFYTIEPWKCSAAATLSLLRGSDDDTALYLLHSLCPE
jgi:hypothetical protein